MEKKIIIFLIFIFAFLGLITPVWAQEEGAVLQAGETINNDYFVSGNPVTIAGTVNGDVYAAAGNLVVTGTINGDLLAVGGMVNISGRVLNDVRVIGGQVVISGEVGGNVSLASGMIHITNEAKIGGGLAALSGSVSVFSPVGRGINAVVGQMTLANVVNGDVRAYVGQLILTPSAQIAGNLTYWSNTEAQIQSGAQIAGTTTRNASPTREPREKINRGRIQAALTRIAFLVRLVDFVSVLVIGLFFLYAFPRLVQRITETISKEPWKSLGVGLLALITTPIIVFILMVLVVGIPLALILWVLYLIALYLSRIFVVLLVGQWILRKGNWIWAWVLGLFLYEVVTLIPFLGSLVSFFILLFGLGAIVMVSKDYYYLLRNKELL